MKGPLLLVAHNQRSKKLEKGGPGWGRVAGDDTDHTKWSQFAQHLVSHAFKELGLSSVSKGCYSLDFKCDPKAHVAKS